MHFRIQKMGKLQAKPLLRYFRALIPSLVKVYRLQLNSRFSNSILSSKTLTI